MLLRRCTQGLCLISLLLTASALVLDNMAVLLAGGTLIAGILGQYLVFDRRLQEIVTSVEIRRSPGRNPVRKGTPVPVVSMITFRGSSRMHVQIADLLPPDTILADGITTVTTRPDPSLQTHRCSYRIIPVSHGSKQFAGISVTVRNLFFEDSVQLTRERDRDPVLVVLPTGLFAAPVSELSDGTRDNRKVSVRSGADIHSLREYCIGDDLRHVDWKISAKYDKLVIRKYAGVMSHPPLVIIDLPWNGAPYPEKEFNRMVSEATGMVRHTIETYQYVSVLIISGPNILHLIREEKNIPRCFAELREWMHPADRFVHFYHMPDRSDLRSHVREIENAAEQTTDTQMQAFYELLRNRYLSVLQFQRAPVFSGQVARTLSQLLMTDAYLFSLGCGDTSHIRHIVRPLQSRMIRVHLRIVDATHAGNYSTRDYPVGSPGVR